MVQSDLSRKVEKASNFVQMVDVLIKDLKLPDPTKRKGLKQFATNFALHNRKINACYDAHSQPSHKDFLVLAAIANFWAKLALDSLLRDRLLANGVLERMAPLLKEGPEDTRQSVLLALSNLTRHGGDHARKSIATLTYPAILDLLDSPDCRPRVAELCVSVLSHTMSSAIAECEERHEPGGDIKLPASVRDIDGVRLLSAITEAMRRPDVNEELVSHGLELLRTLAYSFRKPILETSGERPMVAALASPNIQVRLLGCAAVLRLGSSITEREGRMMDPMNIWHVASNMEEYFNPTLMEAMRNQYGGIKGGMIMEMADSGMGMVGPHLGGSGDYLEVGREFARKILESEYSLGAGFLFGMGGDSNFDRAIKALRRSRDPADAHLPYILEIKMAMGMGNREKVRAMSSEAINHFPDVGYFYYALAGWTQDPRTSLRTAKKGLACPGLTDYIKRGFLQKSAESAFEMTMDGPLGSAAPGSPAWREAVAILHCAQEDSKAYIEITPMDHKNMKTMIYTYLCVTFILEGDEIYKDLDRIKPYLEKLSIAEQIYAIVVQPLRRIQRKLAIDTIVPLFAKPMKNWRAIISRLDDPHVGHHRHQKLGEDDPDHVLANWLARTALDDEDAPKSEFAELGGPDLPAPGTRAEDVLVYRCSLCGNPSASLRKCARCKSTRYCDDSCQRKHWKKGHKLVCKPSDSGL